MKFNKNDPSKDHPHAYGDKQQILDTPYDTGGSSPRVWGQGSASVEKLFKIGIIPTRMGTSVDINTLMCYS